jgi:hypothetical protein
VTQSSVIPAQRNRAPPCQIAADAAFLDRLKIRLKGAKGVSQWVSQQFSTEKFILRLLGIGRSARVNRLEEGVEQMHCVAARRGDRCLPIGTNSAIPLNG